jgi:hypothetical protein
MPGFKLTHRSSNMKSLMGRPERRPSVLIASAAATMTGVLLV